MVLAFNIEGVLPEGEYELSLTEFKTMFVYNERRAWIFEGFLKLVDDLRAVNCRIVYIDGSFVTDKEEPGDMDVCWQDDDAIDWDLMEKEFPLLWQDQHLDPPRYWQHEIYRSDVFPASMREGGSNKEFKEFFKQNKETGNPKGIIKIRIDYDKE